MLGLGDIVARAGRSLRLMVVDVDGEWITVAFSISGDTTERRLHVTGLKLLVRAPWPKPVP